LQVSSDQIKEFYTPPSIPTARYLTFVNDTTNGDKNLFTSSKAKYDNINNYLDTTTTNSYNIVGNGTNQLVYQASSGNTMFLPSGLDGQFLMSRGSSSAPEWKNITSGNVFVNDFTWSPPSNVLPTIVTSPAEDFRANYSDNIVINNTSYYALQGYNNVSYEWTITLGNGVYENTNIIIPSYTSSTLSIPANKYLITIPNTGIISVTLKVTSKDYPTQFSVKTINIILDYKLSDVITSVTISAPESWDYSSLSTLRIFGTISPRQTNTLILRGFSYAWKCFDENNNEIDVSNPTYRKSSLNSLSFVLDKGLLTSGKSYKFRLTVTLLDKGYMWAETKISIIN
jgi:hypothetical protein